MPATEAPALSLVLPVLNEGARLPALLCCLSERFPDAEILVVDGGSRDDSVAVALRRASVVLLGATGRAAQMNLGAQAARGRWLLFLHADSTPQFTQADLLQAIGPVETGWAFFDVVLVGHSPALAVIAWFMNRRSRLTRVATGDQGLLIDRDSFARLGGFAAIPLMEDIELCKRLRRGCAPFGSGLRLHSSGRRWEEQGVVATVLRMWLLRLAYWLGVSPRRLWHHYYGRRALAGPARESGAAHD